MKPQTGLEIKKWQNELNQPKNKGLKDYIVKRFLVDLGIPAKKIITENKSRDTFENAEFTHDICTRKGYERPILVTSAYHLKRATMAFKRIGLKVLPFPAGFRSWPGKTYGWQAYLPGNFITASIAVKEYLGLIFFFLIL